MPISEEWKITGPPPVTALTLELTQMLLEWADENGDSTRWVRALATKKVNKCPFPPELLR